MFKRISIIFLVLCTILAFTLGVNATALTVVKPADNSYIEYLSGSTSILKIGPDSVFTTSWTTTNTYTSMAVTDATDTSLTTNAVVVTGGIAVTKRLWLGDDINMTTNGTGIYQIVLNDGQADGLSIVAGANTLMLFDTSTDAIVITPPLTVTGLVTLGGGLTVGSDGAGETVTFYGDNSGSDFIWDETGDSSQGTLTLGGSTYYVDFKVFGDAASTYLLWDGSEDDLLLVGATTQFAIAGTTTSTTSTTGSLRTAGGLGVAGTANFGDTVGIAGAVTIGGAVGITGNVTLVSTSKLYFLDTEIYIYSSADGVLDIESDGTIAMSGAITTDDTITATADSGATVNFNGIYATVTVTGDIDNSLCALRVKAVYDSSARTVRNFYGANIAARLVHLDSEITGMMAGLQVGVDMGAADGDQIWAYGINIDFTEIVTRATDPKAFISFQDYDFDGTYHCANLFDIGGGGSRVSTGTSGFLHFNDTLRILVNTVAKFIPLSSAEGTYTSAYPMVLTNSDWATIYVHVTTAATDGRYGLYSWITATQVTGAVWGVYGDVSWTGSGYVGLTGVKGRVTVGGNFNGGTDYVYGTAGELVFANGTTINNGPSIFAALHAVITGETGGTFTTGNISGLFIQNLFDKDISGKSGVWALLYMANNVMDKGPNDAIHIYGPWVDNFVYFNGCENGGMVDTSHAADDTSTGRIRISINGDERWLYYWD